MKSDYPASIRDLPPKARLRALAFLEEGRYYGWRLKAVTTRLIGNVLQCRLDFETTSIVFLTRREDCAGTTLQNPTA